MLIFKPSLIVHKNRMPPMLQYGKNLKDILNWLQVQVSAYLSEF